VFAEPWTRVLIRLIHDLAAGVAVDGEGAGVHAASDAERLHRFQHVARAIDIDALSRRRVAHANLVPAREVEDTVRTGHRPPEAFAVGYVAGHYLHTELR